MICNLLVYPSRQWGGYLQLHVSGVGTELNRSGLLVAGEKLDLQALFLTISSLHISSASHTFLSSLLSLSSYLLPFLSGLRNPSFAPGKDLLQVYLR